jgi:hypothetical protein
MWPGVNRSGAKRAGWKRALQNRRWASPLPALLLFFAFTAPLGIAAHLISELAGLGWHDDADVAFSARHGYLALIAVAALAALGAALRAVPRGDRRARIAQIVDALPFKGQGAGFVALSFLAQFAFFAITQIGEGCPLCGGDVFTGVLAAALAALCGSIAVVLGKRRLLDFVLALAWAVVFSPAARGATRRRVATGLVVLRGRSRTPFAFRYRPPPVAAASL